MKPRTKTPFINVFLNLSILPESTAPLTLIFPHRSSSTKDAIQTRVCSLRRMVKLHFANHVSLRLAPDL